MKHMNPSHLEHVFLPEGCLMFSDLAEQIAQHQDLKPERVRDLISGLNRVADVLGRPPSEVPADPRWLQPRLAKVSPAAHGITIKTWQNALSNARAAMATLGIVGRRNNRLEDFAPEWRDLWVKVIASKYRSLPALRRFVHFLSRCGIGPHDVTDADAETYLEAVKLNEISKSPETAYRAAVTNWNLAVKAIPGWPSKKLTLPKRGTKYLLPPETFPDRFHESLDALMVRLATPDPLDLEGPQRALRPQTLFQYHRQLMRFAAELVASGFDPQELDRVEVMLDPINAERGLRQMLARKGNQSSRFIAEMAGLLRNLARILQLDDTVHEQLAGLAQRLKMPVQKGMTSKNRDRLRTLQDPETLRKLLNLPEALTGKGRGDRTAHRYGLACEDAIAIALLLHCPVRAKNLVSINLEQHIQRPGDGRAYLVISEAETKTGQPVEFEIPAYVMGMIDRHLARRAPAMCAAGSPWLFPRRRGDGHVSADELSGRLKRRIKREIGIEMNAHLFRHLAVMIWLDANPGAYEAARRLLGHSDVSMTINLYSGLETRSATSAFSDLVIGRKERLS